jgi:NADH-quinone oxidoreductase subunit M
MNIAHDLLLTLHIGLPALGFIILSQMEETQAKTAQYIAMLIGIATLLLCWPLWSDFSNTAQLQFEQQVPWINWLHVHYYLAIDGISMPLILLTVLTHFIITLSTPYLIKEKVPQYLAAFLLMQAMTIGVFSAQDMLLFYLFWEGMLIPMYLCIGIWGSQQRVYAATKFFLYTFFGSVLMLLALLYLAGQANSFSLPVIQKMALSLHEQKWIFMALTLAFAIKTPMWPVHTWLPDAHTEAPAGGSVVLAALLLKVGGYGFFRLCLPIVPQACAYFAPFMIGLSLMAIVYVGIVTITQNDMKRLIAYSSIAHMGFVTLGCFLVYQQGGQLLTDYRIMGVEGAMIQMIAHGFSSGALFLAFGFLYQRHHARQISDFGGIATIMPYFSAFFVIFCLSNVGLPGTAGFVGEFMVIMSSMKAHWFIAALASTTLIVSATYTLWMVKRVFYGQNNPALNHLSDICWAERFPLMIWVVCIVLLGLHPNLLLEKMHPSMKNLAAMAQANKIKPKTLTQTHHPLSTQRYGEKFTYQTRSKQHKRSFV